jgi:hypothetical protein
VKARGKRFCIIADNSGSMGGAKIHALRNELLKTLGDFEKGGEFYIYCFNSDVEPMPHRTWLTASAPECAGIRRWIREIDVKGGTEPAPAFDAAFRLDPLPDIIYFMTDGMIPREVPAHVERLNRGQPKVVIHTIMFGKGWFSEGAEAGLVKIADQSGGTFSRRGIEGSDSGPGLAAAVCGSCLCVLFAFAVFIALGSSVLRSLFKAGKPGRRRRRR